MLIIAALYHFTRFDDPAALRGPLLDLCLANGVKGTLLLAREAVAWGETATVLTSENLLKARRMVEAFDSHAAPCQRDAA